MTEKEKYFEELRELENAEVFLTDATSLINEEIKQNCIWLSISSEIAEQCSVADFISFFHRVKQNCRQQLLRSNLDVDLIYYLWFDEQAGQLRFNFINSNHDKLPFRCAVDYVDSEKEIISDFLNSHYVDGIPWAELEVNVASEQQKTESLTAFTLKVFRQIIRRQL